MDIVSSYSVKIRNYNRIFNDTAKLYREAVDYFICVCLSEWDVMESVIGNLAKQRYIETCTHATKNNTCPRFAFDQKFYKFPSYLRRSAISAAIGKVLSYKRNLANYETGVNNHRPSIPKAGFAFPAMYRDNCFMRTGTYTARIKVYIRNTWDWLDVELRKSDVDYINRRYGTQKECAPILRKRGKEWFLDFAFEEKVTLCEVPVPNRIIVAVDLGINNACTCSVMNAEGTILDRKFLHLSREQDSLYHALNRIKKAQQNGARHTPRLWAKAKSLNEHIAGLTANFVIDIASYWSADVIVFEYLKLQNKKEYGRKQQHHLWKAQRVQGMVEHKAHRLSMRISRVCAAGTSMLAYDGSGAVKRCVDGNYSVCKFRNGKIYNCDLSASYNVGARYFVREILKSLPETERLDIQAKVPGCAKRTTCTLSTLLELNAVMTA